MSEVALIARFELRPEHVNTGMALLEVYARSVRAEPGNVEFRPAQSNRTAGEVLVFERYASQEAFDAHLAAAEGTDFNTALHPLLTEQVHLTFLTRDEPADWSAPTVEYPAVEGNDD